MQKNLQIPLVILSAGLLVLGCDKKDSNAEDSLRPVDGRGQMILARTTLGPVRIHHIVRSRYDLDLLKRLAPENAELLETYLRPLHLQSENPELANALLLMAATDAGYRGDESVAWEMLESIGVLPEKEVPSNLGGHPIEMRRWVDEDGRTVRVDYLTTDPLQAVLGYLAIRAFLEDKWKRDPGEQTLEDVHRQMSIEVDVSILKVPWEVYVAEVPDPEDHQVNATFGKYRDVAAGTVDPQTNPYGLGYRIPARMDVEMIEVFGEKLLEGIDVEGPDIMRFFQENREEFADPETGESLPRVEIEKRIRTRLKSQLARRRLQRLEMEIQGELFSAESTEVDSVMEQAANRFLPEGSFRISRSGLVRPGEIADLWQQTGLSMKDLPSRAALQRWLEEPGRMDGPEARVNLVLASDSDAPLAGLLWRLADWQPEHAPEDLSQVVQSVSMDLRLIEAGKIALETIRQCQSRSDLEALAREADCGPLKQETWQPGRQVYMAQEQIPYWTPYGILPPPEDSSGQVLLSRQLMDHSEPNTGPGNIVAVSVPSEWQIRVACVEQVRLPEKVSKDRMLAGWQTMQRVRVIYNWLREDFLLEHFGVEFED